MTPSNIQSGYWVATKERFVACYNTREEAVSHIEYQVERFKSPRDKWTIYHISIKCEM